MTLSINIVGCILGVLFMWLAFFGTAIRPAFSFGRGPSYAISKPGKVIWFLAGMALFIDGLARLLRHTGLSLKWRVAVPLVAVAVLVLLLNSQLVRTRSQVTRRSEPTTAIDYRTGLPLAMVAARVAFFVIVAVMVAFGVVPMADFTAKSGIVACVIALFVLAFLHAALESHYVNTGRATIIKSSEDDQKDER